MKDLEQIRSDFNNAIAGVYDKNRQVIDDIEFANVAGSQWKGADTKQFVNRPKPENNKIARQVNRILGQYQRLEINARINPASEDANEEGANTLQGLWRNDFNKSDGVEAMNNAAFEAFYGGFGAIKLVSRYEDEENPNKDRQHICIEPVYSAASSVVFSAGSLRKDKADAKQCWQLIRVNRREFEEEHGINIASYSCVLDNDYFDWSTDNSKDVYIAHYYEVVKRKYKKLLFPGSDDVEIHKKGRKYFYANGDEIPIEEITQILDLEEYEEVQAVEQYVEHAVIDGNSFIEKPKKTPFKSIPIIPQYGYHVVINGIEYYCGEVARQRDNQRFLNMANSALMQIMSRDQVPKDEYAPEQVARHTEQFKNAAVEDYAYLVSDPILGPDGSIVHLGPIDKKQPPAIGSGLQAAIQFLSSNMEEQGGTGQSTLPANISAQAVQQVNDRQDDSYQILFQNAMQTIKKLCRSWIDGAKNVYFSSKRNLRVQNLDGSYRRITTNEETIDIDRGVFGPFKNSAYGKYDVTIRPNESHKTLKDEERATALEILQYTDSTSPIGQMAALTAILSTTGEGTEDIRKVARSAQLSLMLSQGVVPTAKSEEEQQQIAAIQQQMAAQQQQPQQDPQVMIGQAEMMKGQAAMIESQKEMLEAQTDAKHKDAQTMISAANAETNRIKALTQAQKYKADIELDKNKLLHDVAKTM